MSKQKITARIPVHRRCPECLGLIPSGRCPCKSVRPHYTAAPEGSVEAAHFYHLIQSVRSGSWAKTGYCAPRSADRDQLRGVFAAFGGDGFSLRRRKRSTKTYSTFKGVQYFVFRCELAWTYQRDEFAKLCATRLLLWLAGCTNQKVADYLQLSLDRLRDLDQIIRHDCGVNWPHKHAKQSEEFLKMRRRMRAGVAAAILRRVQHGYTTPLEPSVADPFVEGYKAMCPFIRRKAVPCWFNNEPGGEDDLDRKLDEMAREREDDLAFENCFSA